MTTQPDPAIIPTYTKTPMTDFIDYGDDGSVRTINDPTVENSIDSILEYVESRFDILDSENRQEDIVALCQEFFEWGTAEEGDDLGYLFLNYLGDE